MDRQQLVTELFETMSSVKRGMHTRMQSLAQTLPISRSQLELLFALRHLQPTSANQLAKHLSLTPGAVSQLVESLAQLDLVTRQPVPGDRRSSLLQLSPAGEQRMQDIEKKRHELMKHILEELTTDELRLLLQIQRKMISTLQDLPQKTNQKRNPTA